MNYKRPAGNGSPQTHEFACFYQALDTVANSEGTLLQLRDDALYHRMSRVLRVNIGDHIILFGSVYAARVTLCEYSPLLIVRIVQVWRVEQPRQHITVWLPLLEREAFETAVAQCAVFGVNVIVPLVTQKTKRRTITVAERERYTRLMIAAQEQSKQFVRPLLQEPAMLMHHTSLASVLLLTPTGVSFRSLMPTLMRAVALTCIVGPEGDFTKEEYAWLQEQGIMSLRLGSSVLRSELALTVALGLLRAST